MLPIADRVQDRENALAAVIALDQFPRNMFRGTPRAFATDAKAREIADCAIASGFDAALSKDQRTFLYLPYQHAEDAAAQARGVELVASLEDAELTRWAVVHKDIIDRFEPGAKSIHGGPARAACVSVCCRSRALATYGF